MEGTKIMDKEKAKMLLDCYQPALGPQGDAEMQRALDSAQQDTELRAWFEEQQAFDAQISRALEDIPVPPDLRRQILAGAQAQAPRSPWQRYGGRMLLLAAAVALFAGVLAVLTKNTAPLATDNPGAVAVNDPDLEPWQEAAFANLESGFKLEWVAGQDQAQSTIARMTDFLRNRQAPVPADVLANLQDDQILGCLKFNTAFPMSQICFTSGDGQVVHIITVAHSGDSPADRSRPQPARFGGRGEWSFASWTDDDAGYMLVTRGAADLLRDYL